MAELKADLSSEYAYQTGLLEAILLSKPRKWLDLRKTTKSDTACDREWDMTEDGQGEIKIKFSLKRIEKLISAINSRLRVAENEAKTQW